MCVADSDAGWGTGQDVWLREHELRQVRSQNRRKGPDLALGSEEGERSGMEETVVGGVPAGRVDADAITAVDAPIGADVITGLRRHSTVPVGELHPQPASPAPRRRRSQNRPNSSVVTHT